DELGEQLALRQDTRFDPPFSTLQVGVIKGGAALNIVPQHCQFDFEIRHLPDVSLDDTLASLQAYAEGELLPKMRATAAGSAITFQPLSQYPGLLSDPQSAFAGWLAQWAECEDFSTVAFGTEGGLFDEAGVATLVCGPGSMEQGHKADEFVSEAQLEKCAQMLKNLCRWM
ncbi:TPA: M20/M25/M40 family metallo-hydrolase, partial [Klebsiella pneumoniae subsp. ozaenae]|nr:M20/M25/M40 family metallo-hydrolase [Klebsiella pneumoniae subsp. ozaenae]